MKSRWNKVITGLWVAMVLVVLTGLFGATYILRNSTKGGSRMTSQRLKLNCDVCDQSNAKYEWIKGMLTCLNCGAEYSKEQIKDLGQESLIPKDAEPKETTAITEVLPYSDYEVFHRRRSKVDLTRWIRVSTGFHCPKCKQVQGPLEHGEQTVCDCGLVMQLWGNGLDCILPDEGVDSGPTN